MNRPWLTWGIFGLCLLVVLAAMGWVSSMALELERAEARSAARLEFEQTINVALWRMESALSPLVVAESSRPFFTYGAFYSSVPPSRGKGTKTTSTPILVPSPLLGFDSGEVLLHFQFDPDGSLSSPQVPEGELRDLALRGYTTEERIATAAARLEDLGRRLDRDSCLEALPRGSPAPDLWTDVQDRVNSLQQSNAQQVDSIGQQTGLVNVEPSSESPQLQTQQRERPRNSQEPAQLELSQVGQMGGNEFAVRRQIVNRVATQNIDLFQNVVGCAVLPPELGEQRVVMKPLWIGDSLILTRRVVVDGLEYIQGCWLNWDSIRQSLLDDIDDLLSAAQLVPVRLEPDTAGSMELRLLAWLPLGLLPGPEPAYSVRPIWSLRLPLGVAWSGALVAALAVGLLMRGAVKLSERRGSFVSAVTHELRTPLTTFRLYADMLAEDMVQDDERRRSYYDTLRTEAERLGHMVENVLAYARLERGRASGRLEAVSLEDLILQCARRLANRAEQAGMEFVVENRGDEDVPRAMVLADPSAVEQVLLNLVDNACKYAAAATDRRIHLISGSRDGSVSLTVCDHGPGLSADVRRRLFRPFSKSAREAASSAPGVGLGLALSRRLARAMGGDLRHAVPADGCGTGFVLTLRKA